MVHRRLLLVALVDAGVLVAARPDLGSLRREWSAPHAWVLRDGVDAVAARLAGVALWLVAVRVAVALLAVGGSRLPGVCGRGCARLAEIALPAVLRRVVIGSAGLGVLLAPVAAGAHAAPGPTARPVAGTAHAARVVALPAPVWPATPGTSPGPVPGPVWPTRPPAPHPGAHPAPPGRATSSTHARVEVRPGDCLWALAAHRLGPSATDADVAAYVLRAYAANRGLIGDDPDLVRPGQRLDLPPTHPVGTDPAHRPAPDTEESR